MMFSSCQLHWIQAGIDEVQWLDIGLEVASCYEQCNHWHWYQPSCHAVVAVSRFIKVVGRKSKQQSPNRYATATISLKRKFLTRVTIPPVRPLSADLPVKLWAKTFFVCVGVHTEQGSSLKDVFFFFFLTTVRELLKICCCPRLAGMCWRLLVGGTSEEKKAWSIMMCLLDGLIRLTLTTETLVSSNILQVVCLQT